MTKNNIATFCPQINSFLPEIPFGSLCLNCWKFQASVELHITKSLWIYQTALPDIHAKALSCIMVNNYSVCHLKAQKTYFLTFLWAVGVLHKHLFCHSSGYFSRDFCFCLCSSHCFEAGRAQLEKGCVSYFLAPIMIEHHSNQNVMISSEYLML